MGTKLLLFALGLAVGAGVCAAVLTGKAHRDQAAAVTSAVEAASATFSNQLTEMESALAAAKTRLSDSQESNDKLTARVQALMKKEAALTAAVPEKPAPKSGFAALFGGDGTNGMSEAMSGMMKSAVKQQIEGKMSGMKAKLNLTPAQEASIREILDKQMSKGTEMAEKMFKGELTKEELAKMGKETQTSEQDQIKALLTPEQLTAYDDYEKEEKTRMARLMANSEMLQMQGALQLSEEQQDKVFAVLAKQAQSQLDPKSAGAGAYDFEKLADQKKQALKDVLTPEQMQKYEAFQEQQTKLIKAFLPKDFKPATPTVK